MQESDVIIIGGGIVGLATAYNFVQRFPRHKIVILEKEDGPAKHQTGRNSGVLHSGIYYKPGSLKAQNCRTGKQAMEVFCHKEGVPYEICGKVIVATEHKELERLDDIYLRGQKNGVTCEKIGPERLKELEPHAAGLMAIHVPETGIVDYIAVCEKMLAHIREAEGQFVTGARVFGMTPADKGTVVQTTQGEFKAGIVVNCAGLHSDRMTALSGQKSGVRIVPFRGEFFKLTPEAEHLCRTLIYPVPDPRLPFLGVHFTKLVGGGVECGPNAVLAFAREGYSMGKINLRDLIDTFTYKGFLKLSAKYWQVGVMEMWRSFSKAAFVGALQKLIPEIRSEHLETAPSGVRAQAVSPEGNLVDDFMIEESDRVINVCNAPSPAATAALNIGREIVDKLAKRYLYRQ
jgi:L-2-hydroxyglutarate oxidase